MSALREIPFRNYTYFGLGVGIFIILAVLSLHSFLPPQVPLFYGLPQSEDQLTPSWALIIPSLVSVIITLVNVFLSFWIKDDFLKKCLVLTGLVAIVFSTITTLKIIFLVGSF